MYKDALRDLSLAGVQWEITELPTTTAAALAAAEREMAKNSQTAPKTAADDIQIPDSARTPVYSSGPVVVPRIAPIILSSKSPIPPDKILPDSSSSELGMSVKISNLPCPMCGKTVFVAALRNG